MPRPPKYFFFTACIALTAFIAARPVSAQQTGTLVFDLKNYTSDAKMPKKSQKTLEHAGVRWTMLDNTLLISFVSENFIHADLSNLTRFGEHKTLQLKPGQYTITCVGYEFDSASTDPAKNLAKSAFFNNDVLTFNVLPGKTTTLEVTPIYEAESHYRFIAKLTILLPDLKVRIVEDGATKVDDIVINRRTEKSVAWNDYHGPLKF
ncbi:MAG: hypothetical protein WA414_08795 [Acidobacteriaceae bacterium]